MIVPQRYLERKWSYVNLYGLLLGFIIGHCIILFTTLFTAEPISLSKSAVVLVFSVLISVAITNAFLLMAKCLNKQFTKSNWLILVFYVTCMLGMLAGTLLSFGVLRILMNVQFSFREQLNLLGINLLISIVVSSSVLLYEWQRSRHQSRKMKQEIELIKLNRLKKQAELRTIHEKINPHFLYNSLNAIAGLICEDAAKAETMTLKLAQLYRYSVSGLPENFSTIREELLILKNYLEIEQVRFGDAVRFEMHCDPDVQDLSIPRFLLQPILENAVKHGRSNTLREARVRLHIGLTNGAIAIAVYDNGQDFPEEIRLGYGFKSTYEKLKLLYGHNYVLKFVNSPQKHVCIVLPILSTSELTTVC